jgi:hypothetical protein
MKYGLLGAFYRVRTFQDLGGGNEWITGNALALAARNPAFTGFQVPANLANDIAIYNGGAPFAEAATRATGAPFEGDAYILTPYFIGSFGDLDIQLEGAYAWGSGNYDDVNKVYAANGVPFKIPDRDLEVYAYNIEATYHLGPVAITGGYAFVSGDELGNDDDDKITAYGLFEESGDFTRGFILNDADYTGLDQTLGGIGNLSGGAGSITCISGYKMFYLGLGYAPLENLNLEVLYANSKAESPIDRKGFQTGSLINPALAGALYSTSDEKWDDDHGSEYDFILSWKFADNVEYKFIAAYLAAGDFWKRGVADAKVDDLFTLFHMVSIRF